MLKKSLCLVFVLAFLAPIASADSVLEVVEAEYVCMVNDAAYDKEQVRVDVEGKTYYGCCEMCKARLENNEQLRVGIDPVSGTKVDKATAIIAADAYNRVYYFESQETSPKRTRSYKKSSSSRLRIQLESSSSVSPLNY